VNNFDTQLFSFNASGVGVVATTTIRPMSSAGGDSSRHERDASAVPGNYYILIEAAGVTRRIPAAVCSFPILRMVNGRSVDLWADRRGSARIPLPDSTGNSDQGGTIHRAHGRGIHCAGAFVLMLWRWAPWCCRRRR